MNDYSQPDFYRFNSDSIKLVNFILDLKLSPMSILDLGAGCGILGIELSRILKPDKLSLVELQKEFEPHLEMNARFFLDPKTKASIFIRAFSEWKINDSFDLIVSNPPYFLEGRGQNSPNPNRNYARSFSKDGWNVLMSKIKSCLRPDGKSFMVVKKDSRVELEIKNACTKEKLRCSFHDLDQLWIIESNHFD